MGKDESSDRQPNLKLRRQRELRGWSQADVEKELSELAAKHGEMGPDRNSFGRWERGIRRPQPRNVRLLCQLFKLPPEELGLVPEAEAASSEGLVVAAPPISDVATVWSALPAHQVDSELLTIHERLSAAERVALGQALGQNIESAWKLFHTADTEQMLAVSRALLYMLRQHHDVLSPSLLSSYHSLTYRLLGATHHRRGHYEEALRAHHSAYLAALEAGDAWNMAESRSWQAYGMTALGQHADALQAIEATLRLLSQRLDPESIRLQARLLSSAANTAATLGDAREADAKLRASEVLLDQLPGLHEEFDRVAWLESAGVCALRLGRLQLATNTLQQALSEVPVQWVARHVFTAIALSTVLARRRDREAALSVASVALSPLKAARSRELSGHFFGFLRNELLPAFPDDRQSQAFADEAEQTIADDA